MEGFLVRIALTKLHKFGVQVKHYSHDDDGVTGYWTRSKEHKKEGDINSQRLSTVERIWRKKST
jgi:hypothetical protein